MPSMYCLPLLSHRYTPSARWCTAGPLRWWSARLVAGWSICARSLASMEPGANSLWSGSLKMVSGVRAKAGDFKSCTARVTRFRSPAATTPYTHVGLQPVARAVGFHRTRPVNTMTLPREPSIGGPVPTCLFRDGNSQAVRIPRALAFADLGTEVEIERHGDELIVRPARRKLTHLGADFRRLGRHLREFRRHRPDAD